MIIIMSFITGLLVLLFSGLLIGQQERVNTSENEVIYYDSENREKEEQTEADNVIVMGGENLKIQEITPLSPAKGVDGQ